MSNKVVSRTHGVQSPADPTHKKRMAEGRKKRNSAINFREVVMRRKKAKEVPSQKTAIRNFCLECMGWEDCFTRVKECTSPECWLYPWRLGKLDKKIS
jgi:hypothetical protein